METTSIHLKKGESKNISLPSHATSGYLWEAESADSAIASAESDNEQRNSNDDDRPDAIGASADERFTLRGLAAGSTHITFRQRRSWEKGIEPVSTKVYEVVVE